MLRYAHDGPASVSQCNIVQTQTFSALENLILPLNDTQYSFGKKLLNSSQISQALSLENGTFQIHLTFPFFYCYTIGVKTLGKFFTLSLYD